MTLADKIVVLDHGAIQQVGTPMELYEHPANLFVAQFIGSPKMNVMPAGATAAGIAITGTPGAVAVPNPPAEVAEIGIRPEDIALLPAGQGDLPGTVDVVERLGSDTYAYVVVDNVGVLTVRIVGNAADTAIGQKVGLKFDPARLHLFDANGKVIGR
jgi:multiple sugar transport system ATP-binding protein